MATKAKGYLAAGAFKKATVWETPVVCGALSGFEILSAALVSNVETLRDESFNGSPVPYPGTAGVESVEGTLSVNMKYQDTSLRLLAMLMGTAGAPSGAGPYVHTLKLAPANDGLFGTLLLGLDFEIWEHANVKPIKFDFSTDGGKVFTEGVFDLRGYTRNINTSSGTNDLTTWATVTLGIGAAKELVTFPHLTIWMNDADGADFSVGDKLCISEVSFSLAREAESDRTTCTQGKYSEPSDNGFASVTGSLTIPAYEDGMRTLIDDCQDKTLKKMKFEFSKDANNKIEFFFPAIQLMNDGPTPDNPGKLPLTLNYEGWRNAAGNPTGTTEDQFYMKITNGLSTDLLA